MYTITTKQQISRTKMNKEKVKPVNSYWYLMMATEK